MTYDRPWSVSNQACPHHAGMMSVPPLRSPFDTGHFQMLRAARLGFFFCRATNSIARNRRATLSHNTGSSIGSGRLRRDPGDALRPVVVEALRSRPALLVWCYRPDRRAPRCNVGANFYGARFQQCVRNLVDGRSPRPVVMISVMHHRAAPRDPRRIGITVIAQQHNGDINVGFDRRAPVLRGTLHCDLANDRARITEVLMGTKRPSVTLTMHQRDRIANIRSRRTEQFAARLANAKITRAIGLPARVRRGVDSGRKTLAVAGRLLGSIRDERVRGHSAPIYRSSFMDFMWCAGRPATTRNRSSRAARAMTLR